MAFIKAVNTADVPAGTMKRVNVDGTEILIANVGGNFYALNNKCPHMGGSLGDGELEGKVVRCPRHGSRYDVTTGQNVGPAKIAFMKFRVKDARSYPVKVEGSDVLVEIGNEV